MDLSHCSASHQPSRTSIDINAVLIHQMYSRNHIIIARVDAKLRCKLLDGFDAIAFADHLFASLLGDGYPIENDLPEMKVYNLLRVIEAKMGRTSTLTRAPVSVLTARTRVST